MTDSKIIFPCGPELLVERPQEIIAHVGGLSLGTNAERKRLWLATQRWPTCDSDRWRPTSYADLVRNVRDLSLMRLLDECAPDDPHDDEMFIRNLICKFVMQE